MGEFLDLNFSTLGQGEPLVGRVSGFNLLVQ